MARSSGFPERDGLRRRRAGITFPRRRLRKAKLDARRIPAPPRRAVVVLSMVSRVRRARCPAPAHALTCDQRAERSCRGGQVKTGPIAIRIMRALPQTRHVRPSFVHLPLLLCAAAAAQTRETRNCRLEWDRARHEQVDDAAFADTARRYACAQACASRPPRAGRPCWKARASPATTATTARQRPRRPSASDRRSRAGPNSTGPGWAGRPSASPRGRQRLLFDNQRWIGNVGWRQNEQTFDALALDVLPAKDLALRYAYLDRVHRISKRRPPAIRWRAGALSSPPARMPRGNTAHCSSCRLRLPARDRDVAASSAPGAAMDRSPWRHRFRRRSSAGNCAPADYANNPLQFSRTATGCWEPPITMHGITARPGLERLGGNGIARAQTRRWARLHAFNGWADKFLVTPANGWTTAISGWAAFGRERAGARATRLAWRLPRRPRRRALRARMGRVAQCRWPRGVSAPAEVRRLPRRRLSPPTPASSGCSWSAAAVDPAPETDR